MPTSFNNKIQMKEQTTEIVHFRNNQRVPIWNENPAGKWLREKLGYNIRIPFFGKFATSLHLSNLITTVGHAAANGRMSGQGGYSAFVNMAIGIGAVAANVADTALGSEITTAGGGRGVADTVSQVTTTTTNDTTQLVKAWTFSGSFAVTEEGILDNATSGGTLLARQVFAAVNVASGDSLQFTHKYST